MKSNVLPFLKKQHTLEEIDSLVHDLYIHRGDLNIKDYTQQCNELLSERREFIKRNRLLKLLSPTLDSDAIYANSSFGPLAGDYLAIRQDLLITWQPSTIALVESVITLARLIFRRQLIHRESSLFHNDKARRKLEMQEIKSLNIEIDRFTASLTKQFLMYDRLPLKEDLKNVEYGS